MAVDDQNLGTELADAPAAAERDGRPAFVVDEAGEIVWAGAHARDLIGAGALDPATRRVLARMAASGGGGLLRLRLGALGRMAPLAFQARPIEDARGPRFVAIEGLVRLGEPTVEALDEEPAEDDAGVPVRDIAAEEGAAQADDPAPDDTAFGDDQDAPPDPRRDLARADQPLAEAEPAERTVDASHADAAPLGADEPFRFAFEIDDQSRLMLASPELRRAVGASADGIVGRSWSDLADDLGLDPRGAVADALSRRGGWGDIRIDWPLGDGRRRAIALSALPMFDRGRAFVGFRGLGRSIAESPAEDVAGAPVEAIAQQAEHGETQRGADAAKSPSDQPIGGGESDVMPGEVPASISATFAEVVGTAGSWVPGQARNDGDGRIDTTFRTSSENEATSESSEPPPAPVIVEAAASEDDQAGRPATDEPPALMVVKAQPPVFEGNVVALRETPPPVAGLSSSEENAFDEIARRLRGLGSRAESDAPASAVVPHELTQAQRALPFSAGAEELTRVIDRLPVGALVLRGGEIAHANRMALEMLGYQEFGDLSGRPADTLFADALPKDRDAPAGSLRLISADGGEVEVDARLSTVSWGGSPATLVSLRRPDAPVAAAAERETELGAMLDVATDGVLTLDGAGRILSANRGAEALFGFSARDVVGSLFTLSLAPESRRAAFDLLDRMRSDQPPAQAGVEVMGLIRHGGAAPLMMTVGRLPGGDDRFCAAMRDIGPWKRAEEQLIAARRQAERGAAQKSDFLTKISHEIRTPLNAIIGFADVMRDERFGPIGSPRYKDYLKDIQASGAHLVKMMDDLVDVSRIESGKLKLDFAPVDLNEIAAQAASLLQPQANRERVIIRTSLARGLPPVLADRRSIRQIMTNLAANAVRLSRPGGQVIVATSLTDIGQAVFRVRDAGAGLSKQELDRAFEPFRPLGVADNDTGSGLGLPLTRALAEANEAALALQSELGQGTLAEVTFPASRVLAG